jgi:anti-anti-sigma factor
MGESLVARQYRHVVVDRKGDVFCVRLRKQQLDESELYALAEELLGLISEQSCRKMALALGPQEPSCLYSVFLAKLITVRRRMLEAGGAMVLCDASPAVHGVFAACQLQDYFDFTPDMASAIERLRG